ncbi:hypothetical protein PCASD_22256 [Puccinia coronata f. sp. avenae]|uniref:Reverse transcriptase Ty1/copia-type domain-containing protein n=1 Tax=Puccinia coronata f. sp. avenae TaxID=200324 RepID=A0A2N5RZD5_9BASI|nr:hypothetical protein PCASD_22256 [Puccinia coronata f. sp. avenae]
MPVQDNDFFPKTIPVKPVKLQESPLEQQTHSNKLLSQEERDKCDSNDSQLESESEEDVQEMLTQHQQIEKEFEPPTQPQQTLQDRSQIKSPVCYGFHHHYKPNTFVLAIRCVDHKHWCEAIAKEVQSIESHGVWENYYNNPPNPLDTTWVFRIKDNCHGKPIKYKGRLCVQSFDQIHGIDYNEKFAPTGKVSTLRMLLLYSLDQNLKITQLYVQGAFLHAPLSKEVYIKTPRGVNCDPPYLKLRKALYGLKQAPKNCWSWEQFSSKV